MKNPRIFVVDVAAQDKGIARGVWIDFFEGIKPETVRHLIDAMLEGSVDDRWEIITRENFAGYYSGALSELCRAAELIHEFEEAAVKGYLQCFGVHASLYNFSERYLGRFESEEDFCQYYYRSQVKNAALIDVFGNGQTLDQFIDLRAIAQYAFVKEFSSYRIGPDLYAIYRR